MNTKLGKDLQIGDEVIVDDTGEVVTIASLDKGFMTRKSRLAHFEGNVSRGWTTVYHDDEYIMAPNADTHSTAPAEK